MERDTYSSTKKDLALRRSCDFSAYLDSASILPERILCLCLIWALRRSHRGRYCADFALPRSAWCLVDSLAAGLDWVSADSHFGTTNSLSQSYVFVWTLGRCERVRWRGRL
jgi:hypothetical protein